MKGKKERLLFRNDQLNKSVVLRRYHQSADRSKLDKSQHIVYFPHNQQKSMAVAFRGGLIHGKLVFKIAKSDPTQELLDRISEEIDFLNMSDSVHSLTLGTDRCRKWYDLLSDQFSRYSMTDNALRHRKRNRDHGLGKLSGTISKTGSTPTTT